MITKDELKLGVSDRWRTQAANLRRIETWPLVAGVSVYLAGNVAATFWVTAHPIGSGLVTIWVIADLAIGLPAVIWFGRTRRQILEKSRSERPHCPQCGAGLDESPLRLVAIATNHCGQCGAELWQEPAAEPPPGLPSKAEFLGRWAASKRELRTVAMIQVGWMLLSLAFPLMALIWDRYLIYFCLIALGSFTGSALWPKTRAKRILRMNGLHCPGCGQALAPLSSQTERFARVAGPIAAATGGCGQCGVRVYRWSCEDSPSAVYLPAKNDFVARARAYNHKVMVVFVIWAVGMFGALALPRIVIEASSYVESPAIELRVKGLQYLSVLAFLGVGAIYLKWRLKRLAKEDGVRCLNCADFVATATVIATGKCWNCGSRIYTRES